MCHSREDFRLDGRLEDEDDDQERKKQEDAQRKQRDPEDLPAVGAESRNRDVTAARGSSGTHPGTGPT